MERLLPLREANLLTSPVDAPLATVSGIGDKIHDLLFPDPFQPFDTPYVQFAICATFEQSWTPVGYTRGELITTLSLAPGEQLTIEIHTWDKSTIQREEELATESEFRVTEKLTQRDALTVVQEMSRRIPLTSTLTAPFRSEVFP
jgi:hypothetical protein